MIIVTLTFAGIILVNEEQRCELEHCAKWVMPGHENPFIFGEIIGRLKKLAKAHDNPQLAEGRAGTWRRKQIAAVIPEIFRP